MYDKKEKLKKALRCLDQVHYPSDFKEFSIEQLRQLCDELREETISIVSETGGHLGAGLGVIELTVALHYVFNTPQDLIVWDIGHQGYPHKIVTGRKGKMHTLRQGGGLSGFLKRSESEYDTFGAGHSSTSISAALGMAVARDIKQENSHVMAVIGDGALSAGMAYEAMNNAGHLKNKLIVILNDNEMSIAPNVGAMHKYLLRLISSKPYLTVRHLAKNVLHYLPDPVGMLTRKAKRCAKGLVNGGNFFEEMGFHYVGPVDGHDVEQLILILRNLRDGNHIDKPILMHIKTQKGKGFTSPIICTESYHAVNKFDLETKIQVKNISAKPTYTKIFADTLVRLASQDVRVVGITAAMPSGTGMNLFGKFFPDRMFDVGIAEQHAVTFAAGVATQGVKPFVAIYSTFLQRAYDQVVHDVAIQSLPVRFAIDRAGLVGADGPTHAGSFDIVFLATLPNFVIMAPANEAELVKMIATAYHINDRPSAFRFPRGEGIGVALPENLDPLPIGKGRIIRSGKRAAVLSLGTRLDEVEKAAELLILRGVDITVADARFAKPLDEELIEFLALNHEILVTVEEGSVGGFGSHVAQHLALRGCFDKGLKFRSLFLPDYFMDHNTPQVMYEEAGLNASNIINIILNLINESKY